MSIWEDLGFKDITNKRLMTWRDADMILCAMAAHMVAEVAYMRDTNAQHGPVERSSGGPFLPGEGIPQQGSAFPEAGWWSVMSGGELRSQWMYEDPENNDLFTPTCWYSFVNLVKQELRGARQELWDNCYRSNKARRRSSQNSRNPAKGTPPAKG